ncbi:hypothetical protein [Flavobacterium tructae]|uniref:hypothetical protein n=1 Tax=Flavobacterium tructae TaxID=1114873 RepID=UPI0035A95FCF
MTYTIVFTGHMIDAPDRKEPRFPAFKEAPVKQRIYRLLQEKKNSGKMLKGIAGGACGGDILFHEACLLLGIPSEIYLALPVSDFKKKSVSFAGGDWEQRFDRLINILPVYFVPAGSKKDVWQAANEYMLGQALHNGNDNTELLVLWDIESEKKSGGTLEMAEAAKQKGIAVTEIDIKKV